MAQRDGGRFWPADSNIQAGILQWTAWTGAELEPVTTAILRAKRTGGGDERIAELQAAAKGLVALVELRLEKSRFLAGPEFSLADISVGSVLAFSDFFGIPLSPFPKTTAWFAAIKVRPAFQKVFATP